MSNSSPDFNPYSAPTAAVADPLVNELELASRGKRLLAVIVDSLPLFVVGVIAAIIIPLSTRSGKVENETMFAAMLGLVGLLGLAYLAYNLFLLHQNGQTFGKKIVGIKAVRKDGSRVELWRFIFLRWLPVTILGAIPLLGAVFSLINILMIFGNEQRCLHDLIADTIVVNA